MVLELIVGIKNDLEQLSEEVNDFLKYQMTFADHEQFQKYHQKVSEIVQELVETDKENISLLFQSKIEPFAENVTLFSNVVVKSMDDLLKIQNSDKYAYNRAMSIIKNDKEISSERVKAINSVFEIWLDYSTIVTINLVRNLSQTTLALQKIDSSQLTISNYGTLLAMACILRMLRSRDLNSGKLDLFVKLGLKHAKVLESFADTIDILCSPDEKKMIENIDSTKISNN